LNLTANEEDMSTYSEFFVSDQHPMYVQRWDAERPGSEPLARSSIVLVHGGVHTGVCWTACPDGRPGWAQYLAARGWTVFVVDWPGVGRSSGTTGLLESSADAVVGALAALVHETGPALLIGHSIGGAIAAKVMEVASTHVAGLISIAPAPHGNVAIDQPPVPTDQAILFDDDAMQHFFCNAPRFPRDAVAQYRRSLCGMSPGVFNALGDRNGSQALVIHDFESVASIPKLVIAGDHDQLVTAQMSSMVAEALQARHVLVGRDWDLTGFGHMIPIETGSEAILGRALDWFAEAARSTG
jgi:alpha-beta hydrolase superfamily lysophospholipase